MQSLQRLQSEGEAFSLAIAQSGEIARIEALREEREALAQKLSATTEHISARDATGKLAQDMIEGLRDAGQLIISEDLQRIAPLAQRVYSSIDPHPAFRKLDFQASMFKGRGRVTTSVYDPEGEVETDRPEHVLSSSQGNALALSVFLALNIGCRELPLDAIILDDPLQSLDDVNLLGLVDVLRRLREHRQVIVSTHDVRFSGLLERKLRPIDLGATTRVVGVNSWGRTGPEVSIRDVEHRPEMYIVA